VAKKFKMRIADSSSKKNFSLLRVAGKISCFFVCHYKKLSTNMFYIISHFPAEGGSFFERNTQPVPLPSDKPCKPPERFFNDPEKLSSPNRNYPANEVFAINVSRNNLFSSGLIFSHRGHRVFLFFSHEGIYNAVKSTKKHEGGKWGQSKKTLDCASFAWHTQDQPP
jgi:hypothetical protein